MSEKFKLDDVFCEDCRFFGRLGKKEDEKGYCHYNPPVVIANRELFEASFYDGIDLDAVYQATVSPVVWEEGSCGKWEGK